MKAIMIVILTMTINNSFSQSINCDWVVTSTGNDNYCTSLSVDHDNNIYSCGYFNVLKFGNYNTILSNGNLNSYFSKQLPNGEIVWVKKFGGKGHCMSNFIRTDSQNNIVIAGYCNGSFNISNFNFESQKYDDLFLLKFTSNGDLIWAKQIKSDATLNVCSMEIDSSDNVYLMVESYSLYETSFENIKKKSDLFIAKYSSTGDVLWVNESIRGDRSSIKDKPMSVNIYGDVYYTGAFKDTIQFADSTYIPKGYWYYLSEIQDSSWIFTNDFFIAKINSLGEEEWIKITGTSGDEIGSHTETINSNVVAFVDFSDSLSIYSNSDIKGGGKAILKYDESGKLLDYKILKNDFRIAEVKSNDEYIFVTGIKDDNIFLYKFDLNFNLIQSFETGGPNSDYGETIAIGNNNDIYLGGIFNENISLGNFYFENPSYGFNLFVARLKSDLVSIQSILEKQTINFYPNPFQNSIKICTSFSNESAFLEIYNLKGELILNRRIYIDYSGNSHINLSMLTDGTYLVKLTNYKTKYSGTIMKNNVR